MAPAEKGLAAEDRDLVIAIDESGNFQVGSDEVSFYVAALVRPGKREQFDRWAVGIPEAGRKRGEIKGGLLSDDQMHDFVREVLQKRPPVRISRLSTKPSMHPEGSLTVHRQGTVRMARKAGERFAAQGFPRAALEAAGQARWFERMSDSQYLKLWVQTECVMRVLVDVVGHSVEDDFADLLPLLRYKIDRGVFGDGLPAQRRYWKRFAAGHSEGKVMPLLDTWQKTGHSFLDAYTKGGKFDFNPLFDKRCDFLASEDSYEIQIADITASIHRAYYGANRTRKSVYERIGRAGLFTGKGSMAMLVLDPDVVPEVAPLTKSQEQA